MIQRREKRAAFLEGPQAVEAHGIEPLEDVAVFAVLRRTSVLLDEALDVLEPGDDALLARRAAALLLRRRELGQFVIQLVEVEITHSGLHL